MKLPLALALLSLAPAALADPQLTSWITAGSSEYARVYQSDAERRAGVSATIWSNAHLTQSLPAYRGVQEISFSDEWIYIRTTGLGQHIMGPWYEDAARARPFVNLPVNQKRLFRLPRHPEVAETKSNVRGDIGFYVDGVHAFDASDAVSYSAAWRRDGEPPGRPGGLAGDRVWNRDAFINEAQTFDSALAHQQNTGDYHYHANPVAPRFLLGDHLDFDATAGVYRESRAPALKHSPIVGWAKDGFPIYGPYGFAKAMDPASGVRRMISGYVRRDGAHGTTAGRISLPAWAARVQGRPAALAAGEQGPPVSAQFPLGRYLEDNDYLGDLGETQGAGFDLDESNGRPCVTPEFPAGTYAYFITIEAGGAPLFPYSVGRRYHGVPRGGEVREITEPATVVFTGGAGLAEQVLSAQPQGSEVALTWSSVEGGTYRVEAASAVLVKDVPAQPGASRTSAPIRAPAVEARVVRTALAPFDPATRAEGESRGILRLAPDHAAPGTRVSVSIQLDPAVRPPPPHAPVLRASLGAVEGSQRRHLSHTEVTAEWAIPSDARPGARPVSVTFPGPPDNPRDEVTYTLPAGFTIDAPR